MFGKSFKMNSNSYESNRFKQIHFYKEFLPAELHAISAVRLWIKIYVDDRNR